MDLTVKKSSNDSTGQKSSDDGSWTRLAMPPVLSVLPEPQLMADGVTCCYDDVASHVETFFFRGGLC